MLANALIRFWKKFPLNLIKHVFRILPESARWLIENGKTKLADETIHKVAKANGKVLTDEFEKDLKVSLFNNQK